MYENGQYIYLQAFYDKKIDSMIFTNNRSQKQNMVRTKTDNCAMSNLDEFKQKLKEELCSEHSKHGEQLKLEITERIRSNYEQYESAIETDINLLDDKSKKMETRIEFLEMQNGLLMERLKWMEKLLHNRNRDIDYCMDKCRNIEERRNESRRRRHNTK
jgi:hypothetical protein